MTADPRPTPPEHADREVLAEIIRISNPFLEDATPEIVALTLHYADAILAAGFARTPESASGTAGISTRFSEHRGDSPGPLLPDTKDGPALGRVEPASGTAEPQTSDDDKCEICELVAAVQFLESGEQLCEGCYQLRLAEGRGWVRALSYAVSRCEQQVTGFKSELHEAYDNGVAECVRRLRDALERHDASFSASAPPPSVGDTPSPEDGK